MQALRDFHMMSQDFLQLMARKAKQADANKDAAAELEVISNFYDNVVMLLQNSDLFIHENKLHALQDRVTSKILEAELRKAYNTIYIKAPALLPEVMKGTALPTKKELETKVVIK